MNVFNRVSTELTTALSGTDTAVEAVLQNGSADIGDIINRTINKVFFLGDHSKAVRATVLKLNDRFSGHDLFKPLQKKTLVAGFIYIACRMVKVPGTSIPGVAEPCGISNASIKRVDETMRRILTPCS